MIAHGAAAAGDGWTALALTVLVAVTVAYVGASFRQRQRRGWSTWRVVSFMFGVVLLALGLVPRALPFDAGDFRQHMLQHLLIGMFAPLGLALGAPVKLLLRSVSRTTAARIARILRCRPARVAGNPYVLLGLNLGGLIGLYFTPLYAATTQDALLHHAVHVHVFVVGYLFTWIIAGADPAPRRPSVARRLVIIGAAILGHAVIAQLLYADAYVRVPVTAAELRGAGDLMYYGGDVAELLLALALVSTWKPRPAIESSPNHHVGPYASLASPAIRGRPQRQPPDSALGPGIGWPGPATPSASAPGPAGRSSVSPK